MHNVSPTCVFTQRTSSRGVCSLHEHSGKKACSVQLRHHSCSEHSKHTLELNSVHPLLACFGLVIPDLFRWAFFNHGGGGVSNWCWDRESGGMFRGCANRAPFLSRHPRKSNKPRRLHMLSETWPESGHIVQASSSSNS